MVSTRSMVQSGSKEKPIIISQEKTSGSSLSLALRGSATLFKPTGGLTDECLSELASTPGFAARDDSSESDDSTSDGRTDTGMTPSSQKYPAHHLLPLSGWSRPRQFDLSNRESSLRPHVSEAISKSVKDGSFATYQASLDRFSKHLYQHRRPLPVTQEEERIAAEDYAYQYVHEENLRGISMKKGFHSSLSFLHTLRDEDTWTSDQRWKRFLSGLENMSKDPVWRFPWTIEMTLEMVNLAIKRKQDEAAAMILISFFGLTRSSFLTICGVHDVLGFHDPHAPYKELSIGGCQLAQIWVSNIKTSKRKFEGGVIRVPDYKSVLSRVVKQERDPGDRRLFVHWTTSHLLAFVQEYASGKKLTVLGYRFDIHAFKAGGSRYLLSLGVSPDVVREIAKWAEDSEMLSHYSAICPPAILDLMDALQKQRASIKCPNRSAKMSKPSDLASLRSKLITDLKDSKKVREVETLDMDFDDQKEDASLEEILRAGNVVCHCCEKKGVYAPVKCLICHQSVHKGTCSYAGKCITCVPPAVRGKKRKRISTSRHLPSSILPEGALVVGSDDSSSDGLPVKASRVREGALPIQKVEKSLFSVAGFPAFDSCDDGMVPLSSGLHVPSSHPQVSFSPFQVGDDFFSPKEEPLPTSNPVPVNGSFKGTATEAIQASSADHKSGWFLLDVSPFNINNDASPSGLLPKASPIPTVAAPDTHQRSLEVLNSNFLDVASFLIPTSNRAPVMASNTGDASERDKVGPEHGPRRSAFPSSSSFARDDESQIERSFSVASEESHVSETQFPDFL